MADIVTGNEFLRMQNDAVNRVKQMQQRADSFVKPAGPSMHTGRQTVPATHRPEPAHHGGTVHPAPAGTQYPQTPAHQQHGSSSGGSGGGLLSGLFGGGGGNSPISGILDSIFNGETDKLLILGMIWLLSKENADQMLIMALFYILM